MASVMVSKEITLAVAVGLLAAGCAVTTPGLNAWECMKNPEANPAILPATGPGSTDTACKAWRGIGFIGELGEIGMRAVGK